MTFRVLDVMNKGFFKHRVELEALETTIVDRIRFRINAVGLSVVDIHQELKFENGDRVSVCVPKNFRVGDNLDAKIVSHAVSSRRWQRISR